MEIYIVTLTGSHDDTPYSITAGRTVDQAWAKAGTALLYDLEEALESDAELDPQTRENFQALQESGATPAVMVAFLADVLKVSEQIFAVDLDD